MSDIFSVIQSAYATAPLTPANTKYTAVDPKSFQGTWSGTYSNTQKFELTISNVSGFRAQVRYQSGATVQYAQVLIGKGGCAGADGVDCDELRAVTACFDDERPGVNVGAVNVRAPGNDQFRVAELLGLSAVFESEHRGQPSSTGGRADGAV